METKIIELKKLFFIKNPGRFCQLPYPGHPKGCPMFGTRPECPPHAPKLQDKYDLLKPCYFVVQPFDIGQQKAAMKTKHPDWSDKQCGCCLYWQNTVRKTLDVESYKFCREKTWNDYAAGIIEFCVNYSYDLIPEAMGLNVFSTARLHGIPMVRNPQDILYKVAFVGILK